LLLECDAYVVNKENIYVKRKIKEKHINSAIEFKVLI